MKKNIRFEFYKGRIEDVNTILSPIFINEIFFLQNMIFFFTQTFFLMIGNAFTFFRAAQ